MTQNDPLFTLNDTKIRMNDTKIGMKVSFFTKKLHLKWYLKLQSDHILAKEDHRGKKVFLMSRNRHPPIPPHDNTPIRIMGKYKKNLYMIYYL